MKDIKFLEDNGVDVKKSLEVFGNVDTYNANIGEFLVGLHAKINGLIKLLGEKDMNNYSISAHYINSDASNFGFTKLAEEAATQEEKSKAGDIFYISNHINDLIRLTNDTIKIVQEYMNGNVTEEVSKKVEVSEEDIYQSKTILVVDDSNIIRNFVKRIFSDNYNVGTAKNGEEAIRIITANKDNEFIETILLDLNMPKVDGFAVLEYMRQNNLLHKMPVSIISGDASKDTIDRAFTYDIVDMLGKPFNDDSIRKIIEKTLIYKAMQK